MIEAGKIHDYPAPNGSARHAAAGASRHERGASLGGPFHESSNILGICRDRYGRGHCSRYPCRLGVNGASEIVLAKNSPKACGHYSSMLVTRAGRRHSPRLLSRGGFVE
jgi:hypothetical protein